MNKYHKIEYSNVTSKCNFHHKYSQADNYSVLKSANKVSV